MKEMVREERLELSRVAPLEPKSSASTSSATLADSLPPVRYRTHECAKRFESSLQGENNKGKVGWTKGFEPSTAGVTILSSTN